MWFLVLSAPLLVGFVFCHRQSGNYFRRTRLPALEWNLAAGVCLAIGLAALTAGIITL